MKHTDDLVGRIGSLLLDDGLSDVELVVEGEALSAHKIILASSCEFFRVLLCGDLKESRQSTMVLENVPLRGFKHLLRYIYTAVLDLKELEVEATLEVLGIAHLYGFEKLQRALCEYLEQNLSVGNVCMIFERAQLLRLEGLTDACWRFMDRDADIILKDEKFHCLSAKSLCQVLSRDSFRAEEIKIFRAVQQWCAKNPNDGDLVQVLDVIRLPLISTADLVPTIKDSGLFTTDRLFEAIREKEARPTTLPTRVALAHQGNIAKPTRSRLSRRMRRLASLSSPTPLNVEKF